MRIGISCNAPRYAGGMERYAMDIARGLAQATTQHNTTQHNQLRCLHHVCPLTCVSSVQKYQTSNTGVSPAVLYPSHGRRFFFRDACMQPDGRLALTY